MTAYQLRYLDRVPPHAAVNEAVAIAKRRGQQAMGGFVNGVLRAIMRRTGAVDPSPADSAVSRIAWEHSHPEWLVARWIAATAKPRRPPCARRTTGRPWQREGNRLLGTREALLAEMRAGRLRAEAPALAGRHPAPAQAMAHSAWYRDGRLSVQDESSLARRRGAAAGTGHARPRLLRCPRRQIDHIAERMGDMGEVTANDVHAHKVALIEEQPPGLA